MIYNEEISLTSNLTSSDESYLDGNASTSARDKAEDNIDIGNSSVSYISNVTGEPGAMKQNSKEGNSGVSVTVIGLIIASVLILTVVIIVIVIVVVVRRRKKKVLITPPPKGKGKKAALSAQENSEHPKGVQADISTFSNESQRLSQISAGAHTKAVKSTDDMKSKSLNQAKLPQSPAKTPQKIEN